MAFGINEYASLFILVFFGVMLVLFIWQASKRKRSARTFLASLIFGVLGSVAALFSSTDVFTSLHQALPELHAVALSLHLNLYACQFLCYYLFFEQLISRRPNVVRFTFVLCLFLVDTFSLWTIIFLRSIGQDTVLYWLFADLSYNSLAIFVFFIFGTFIYWNIFRLTRERRPLVFFSAFSLISIGFVVAIMKDLGDFFSSTPDWLNDLSDFVLVFQAIGLIIFTIAYVTRVDYIYRLPHDVFQLIILYKHGVVLHSTTFQAKRQVRIDEALFSGMITAINNVFQEVFHTETIIDLISSTGVHVLLHSGEYITAILVTDKVSFFLERALKQYVQQFECQFAPELERREDNMLAFDGAERLIPPIFPYFKIQRTIEKKD